MSVQVIRIGADEGEQRLDRWLKKRFPQLNQISIEKLCLTGQIRVDAGRVKPATRIETGQEVRIPPLPDAAPHAPRAPAQARGRPGQIGPDRLRARIDRPRRACQREVPTQWRGWAKRRRRR